MAITKITSRVIGTGAVTSDHLASGAVTASSLSGITTDNVTEGSTNLYFTNARIDSHLSGGTGVTYSSGAISIGQDVSTTATPTFGNITTTGYLAGPATFTIDPAAVGDNTGTVVIAGNLQVDGTTTTVNSTTVQVSDKTIELGYDATTDAANNNAGIVVHRPETSDAYIFWNETNGRFQINRKLNISQQLTVDASGAQDTHIEIGSGTASNHYAFIDLIGDTTYTDYGLRIIRNNGGANTSSFIYHRGTGNFNIETQDSASLKFRTAGIDALTIDSSQNVGIGTNTPQHELVIHNDSNPTLAIVGSGYDDEIAIRFGGGDLINALGNGNSGAAILSQQAVSNGQAKGDLKFQINTGDQLNTAMRITSDGNVSIGSDHSGFTGWRVFNIRGLSAEGGMVNFENGSGTRSFTFANQGSGMRYQTHITGGYHRFETSLAGYAMYINDAGNVGIGTNNPAVRLHSHSASGSPEIRLTTGLDTGTPMSQLGYSSGSGYFLRLGDAANNEDIMFRTYGDSYIANNLGIGVSSPGQKLHVNSGSTNVVARFESSDGIAGIQIKDTTGNVELETYNNTFRVNPAGAANPISFISSATSNYFTTTTSHSGTNQDFDFTILNNSNSNHGPRVRIYGGGQSSAASADVPWDQQQGYNTGSLWFDSGEGPSIYGAGITGVAEADFNGNDTPAALAFYTTPDGTGGQTNTAKERFRLRADGTAHLSPTESNTHLYLGSAGGLTGGNNSINVRAAGNNMMLNSVGQLIVERTGIQKFLVDETYSKVTTNGADGYTIRSENTSTGDPGLAMWRAGQAGFGIAVRTSTQDYADFNVTNNGLPGYSAGGSTTGVMRLYQGGNVSMPNTAAWSTGIGNTFGVTGNHYMVRSSSSTGNESIIINNTTSPGSVGILQYRENAGVQGQYLVGTNGSGITFTGSSDYRLKDNVNTITTSSLDKINQLRLVSYNWNDLSGMPTDTTEIGVLAHEMEEVFPEFVEGERDAVYTQEDLDARGDPETTNEEVGDIKAQTVSLLNKDMIVHILKGMQELKAENDALRARIEVLEG